MQRMPMFLVVLTNVAILGFSQSHYANGNGTIIETKPIDGVIWVFRKHIQSIEIGELAEDENLNVYDKPVLGKGTIIGRLKLGDNINITQVAEAVLANYYYYCVKISANNINGWIFCGKYNYDFAQFEIPYFNNRWEITGKLSIGGKSWTVRKMIRQLVAVWVALNIRDKPGLIGTKVLSTIVPPGLGDPQINLNVTEATEEQETIDGKTDRWLKIKYHGVEGWIFGEYASVERGGRKYFTPDAIIDFKLGYY